MSRRELPSWTLPVSYACLALWAVAMALALAGCSACGKALPKALFRNGWTMLDYCPRCGARVAEEVSCDDA